MGFQVKTALAEQYAGNTSVERCTVKTDVMYSLACVS